MISIAAFFLLPLVLFITVVSYFGPASTRFFLTKFFYFVVPPNFSWFLLLFSFSVDNGRTLNNTKKILLLIRVLRASEYFFRRHGR